MQQEDTDDITEVLGGEKTSCSQLGALSQLSVERATTQPNGVNCDATSDDSDASIAGSDSQESFHSLNEHEYLLSEDQIPPSGGTAATLSRNDNTNSTLMNNVSETSDRGFAEKLRNTSVDHTLAETEDEESLLEKQSFEEAGRVTLYSTMNSKSRRFNKSEYQGFDANADDRDTSGGESCGQDEDNGNNSKNAYLQKARVSCQTSDTSAGVGSEYNGSSTGSDCVSVSSSPINELRHRLGVGNGPLGGSNRIRSYTSPDTRSSIRNIIRNREVRSQSAQGEQRTLISSLDAGMTVLKRWVTTRSAGETSNPRPSRAVQMQNYYFDNNTDSELSLVGEEEDYLALSNAGEHRRQSVSSRSNHGSANSGGSGDRAFHNSTFNSSPIYYPQTIQEEDDTPSRQRANSEPERSRNRHWRDFIRRRPEVNTGLGGGYSSLPRNRTTRRRRAIDVASVESLESGGNSLSYENVLNIPVDSSDRPNRVTFDIESSAGNRIQNDDPNREARRNWVLLNRRFQLVVVLVGLTCSCLCFSILVTWVVLTSAYVVSIDEDCDLPLKPYFWLATIQVILDVFRKEIIKFVFRFEPSRNQQQIPTRVIVYNLAYLTYAMLVLRMGISSVFLTRESTCPQTATNLFNTTRVFVTMSVTAWLLILFGYLIPFCIVAMLLTRNGYSPATEDNQHGPNFGVFPLPDTNNGAPPNCITLLKTVRLEDFGEDYPRECCICMSNFSTNDLIVATECDHVFHKGCCQEWLKQARTCPVCRTDIPVSLGMGEDGEDSVPNASSFEDGLPIFRARGPFRSSEVLQDLENLVSLLRETNNRG